jgi:hypothetical protein
MNKTSAAVLVALGLLVASCGSSDETSLDTAPQNTSDAVVADAAEAVDLSLTRDDVDCSPEAVGSDDEEFTTVHVVVDGVLGAPCLGDVDATLLEAWDALAILAPTLALADLGLFGGFTGNPESDEVTLAFVNALDDDGTLFQMSINLDAYRDDADQSYLTMAHEFSHVFTQLPSQLDRSAEAEETCTTYYNGDGCFFDDSLMALYISEFWPEDLLAELDPPDVAATVESGEERCELNADFLGPYAASNPEEDFAETFSAYVFEIPVDPALDDKIAWMAAQPGLAEFNDRAAAAGLTPLDNPFDLCG